LSAVLLMLPTSAEARLVVLSHPLDSHDARQFPRSADDRRARSCLSPPQSHDLFMIGGALTLYAIFAGGLDTGWTFYTPLSTFYSNGHVVLAATGVFVAGFGSILTGLNFIVTIHRLRAPGLTWHRLPIFLWSLYATSVILVLATPVLAMSLLLIA